MHIQNAIYGLIISASVFNSGAAAKKCRMRTSTPDSAVTTPVTSLSASPESSLVSPSASSSVSSAIVPDSSTTLGSETPTSALETPASSLIVPSSSTTSSALSSTPSSTPESSATSLLESDSTTPILSTSTPEVSSESITSASTSPSSSSTVIPSSTSSASPPPCSPASDSVGSIITTYNSGNGYANGEGLQGIPVTGLGTVRQLQFYADGGYSTLAFKIEACTGRLRLGSSDSYPDNYVVTSGATSGTIPANVGVAVAPLGTNVAYIKCAVPVVDEPYQCQDENSGNAITFYTIFATTQPKLYASTTPGTVLSTYTKADLYINF
ncbi:unnamed protein product [Clonostachys rosea]|uniref:Ubiquitin 3 binding protein But2 C-terminal domain-containing protein n=1 Tax=Bionectria ochroleuca TaxID=29856 RepID=A0ABY6TZI5_BIOOC|nr:unnamed protein product [Clonostachys rosea]